MICEKYGQLPSGTVLRRREIQTELAEWVEVEPGDGRGEGEGMGRPPASRTPPREHVDADGATHIRDSRSKTSVWTGDTGMLVSRVVSFCQINSRL